MRYEMNDRTIVDTSIASQTWSKDERNDHNYTYTKTSILVLYRSQKGRYYGEYLDSWPTDPPACHVEWVSREDAARWLLMQNHELPADLLDLISELME